MQMDAGAYWTIIEYKTIATMDRIFFLEPCIPTIAEVMGFHAYL